MRVRKILTDISSTSTLQQRLDFTPAEAYVVSRFYTVSTRDGERFYPQTLLVHFKGATTFVQIRTVADG